MGHLAVFELFFAIPLSVLGLLLNFAEGTLTLGWAIQVFIVCAIAGAVFALYAWFAVSLPRLKRRGGKQ